MNDSMNGLVALSALFLFEVFIGLLLGNAGQQVDFAILSTERGVGCRVSSRAALP